MKRVASVLLICILFASLCACASKKRTDNGIVFYYKRAEFQYHAQESVIVAESRDVSGHTSDLHYLLSLYLVGPLDEKLVSPFPDGTRLFRANLQDGTIQLILSDMDEALSDSEFTVACACISLTCLKNFDAQQVQITSGQRNIIIDETSLLLYDDVTDSTFGTEDAT